MSGIRARVRKRQLFAALETAQQHAGLDSRTSCERRRLDLAMQPDESLLTHRHEGIYVGSDMPARGYQLTCEPEAVSANVSAVHGAEPQGEVSWSAAGAEGQPRGSAA